MMRTMKLFQDNLDVFEEYYQTLLNSLDSLPDPEYTFYIPSKGRSDTTKTTKTLSEFNLPFKLVVEPQDYSAYVTRFGEESVICMDKNDQGIYYVRQWIKDYSTAKGEDYHWQLDDDLRYFRSHFGKRIRLTDGKIFTLVERLTKDFPNIAQSGLTHFAFAFTKKRDYDFNKQVCSCMLIKNNTPARFRPDIIEDTDFSLQLLYVGLVTLNLNRFSYEGVPTMTQKGGNTEDFKEGKLYKRQLKLCEEYPTDFEVVVKDGRSRIKPSKVWSKFKTEPMRT